MIFFTQGNAYRSMIHGFKYRGQWRTALRLGRWFGTELRESGLYGDVDVVVPVPLHYRRLLSRGYNQAEYFGRGIAEALGVPLDARSVVRSGYNRSQARTTDRSERWDNVKGIFSVRRPASLAGRHLLLVDDVLTTELRSRPAPKRSSGPLRPAVSAWRRWPFRLTSFSAGKARAACSVSAHRDFVGRSAGGFLFFRRRSRPTGTYVGGAGGAMSCNGAAAHTAYSLSR